jgi:hypothetical protein
MAPRNLKTLGSRVVHRPGRQPFVQALTQLQGGTASTWPGIEPLYLQTLQAFDRLVAAGRTTQGDRQNGKGDFFNDVLAILLARCSNKQLHRRQSIPGLIFTSHSLDIAYPGGGIVELTVETKATGIPKHPRSPQQDPSGRAGSADLEKRIKEAAFKDIDLKGHYAAASGQGGGATLSPGQQGKLDLRRWLHSTPPRNWLLLSARVRDEADLMKTIEFAAAASRWFEGCGLYAYGHQRWARTRPYETKRVPPALRMHTVLADVCTALKNLP